MAASRMYIEKFGKEVLIDDDHPDAIAQRAKDASGSAGDSSAPADDYDAMTKDDLVTLADSLGLTVTRADRGDGVPLKSDYIAALRAPQGTQG